MTRDRDKTKDKETKQEKTALRFKQKIMFLTTATL